MEIKVLGSLSPSCNKESNGIGYIVKDGDKKIMLDCGSGISRLMNFPDDLNNLTIIISHLHKDHYADLSSIAYSSFVYHLHGLLDKKIKVYIPDDKDLIDYKYLMNYGDIHYMEFIPYNEKDILNINNINIAFYKTYHDIKTYACSIIKDNIKIVYSADTGYDEKMIDFISNANIFICETSYLQSQKNYPYHLTTKEASLLATKAKVDNLIITHFWPTIDKQVYLEEAKSIFSNVEAAQENKIYKLKNN